MGSGGMASVIPPVSFWGSVIVRRGIPTGLVLVLACATPVRPAPPGVLEGDRRIVAHQEADLDDGQPAEIAPEFYPEFLRVVRSADRREEIARLAVDRDGNSRTSLPAGDCVLDIRNRVHRRVRASRARFAIISGENTRVDMEIDTATGGRSAAIDPLPS